LIKASFINQIRNFHPIMFAPKLNQFAYCTISTNGKRVARDDGSRTPSRR